MNYELAKELKDAGFSQSGEGEQYTCNTLDSLNGESFDTREAYKPTLEELIEACGADFHILERGEDEDSPSGFYWLAHKDFYAADKFTCTGPTPTEAVARLWLALHKNK